ncbi:SDR family oxidoreductase [candidate division KSB1 bacterium]|nr:SDR family oxidoreductase [candidate division KSB1 bacterium]RQW02594.1 MAG: SDR family oxidoreductase [candidate division KSB1 bacterium]
MRKLLVTGMSGFLGGFVFSKAESRFDYLGTCHTYATPVNFTNWQKIDLTNSYHVSELVRRFPAEVFLHLAAISNLDDCEKNPERAHEVNVKATVRLVAEARRLNARFIYVSTDMVFDGQKCLYREDAKTNPISVYGRTKLQAEAAVQKMENAVIVRSALLYGRPRFGGNSFSMWVENRLQQGQVVPLFTDQFRSPIYAGNLADILLELCESDFTGILHAGGTNRMSRYAFGLQLCEIFGYDSSLLKPIAMTENSSLAPRPRDVSLNVDKAITILKTDILSTAEGLRRMRNENKAR